MTTTLRQLRTWCLLLVTGLVAADAASENAPAQVNDTEQPIAPEAVDLGRPVDFTRDIYPILAKNCVACHNVSTKEGEFIAENVADILAGGDSGPAAVEEEPDESLIYLYAARVDEPFMPPLPNQVAARALTPKELGLLRKWIIEGAKTGSRPPSQPVRWRPVPAHIRSIQSVALSHNNRYVAWGRANQIFVSDLIGRQETRRLIDPNLASVPWQGNLMYPAGAAHRDLVQAIALSPDGNLLASGGFRVVKLWRRIRNARELKTTIDSAVTALATDPAGKFLAVGTNGGQIVLMDLLHGNATNSLPGDASDVSDLHFTDDGTRLFASFHNGMIRCWRSTDRKTVGMLQTGSQINSLALNQSAGVLVTAHADSQLRVWDISAAWLSNETTDSSTDSPAPTLLRELAGHTKAVTSISLILGTPLRVVSGSEDATVRIWDLSNGQQLTSIDHGSPVNAVTVRPDQQAIAAAGDNHMARAWDMTGKPIGEFSGTLQTRQGLRDAEDERTVAAQRVEHARVMLSQIEKEIAALELAAKKTHDEKLKSDATLEEAKTKALKAAEILAVAKLELVKNDADTSLQKNVSDAQAESTRLDAAMAAAETANRSAQQAVELVTDSLVKNQSNLKHAQARLSRREQEKQSTEESFQQAQKSVSEAAQPLYAVAFSADGLNLATAGADRLVQLWDVATGQPVAALEGHMGPVSCLLLDRDGRLITGGLDKRLFTWDLNSHWKLAGQLGGSPEDGMDISQSLLSNRVLAVAFSHDGQLLATGGGEPSRSGELMLWDVKTMQRVRQFVDPHSDTVFNVEFSRDGKYLLSGAADKMVKIFEIESGQEVRSFEGHTHHVLDVSWKADGHSMVSAGADNVIKYWDVETGAQIRTIGGFAKQVTSVQFLGTGDSIISCSGDRSVRLHTVSDGKNLRNFPGGSDYVHSATASDGHTIVVAGGEDGVLRLWSGQDGKVLRTVDPTSVEKGGR